MHRFYTRRSLRKFPFVELGTAAVQLACKVTETPRHAVHLLRWQRRFASATHHRSGSHAAALEKDTPEYVTLRDALNEREHLLMAVLAYDFVLDLPFPHLRDLRTSLADRGCHFSGLVWMTAWCLACDALRTVLCVTYPGRAIAIACLLTAQEMLGLHAASKQPPLTDHATIVLRSLGERMLPALDIDLLEREGMPAWRTTLLSVEPLLRLVHDTTRSKHSSLPSPLPDVGTENVSRDGDDTLRWWDAMDVPWDTLQGKRACFFLLCSVVDSIR